MNRFRHAASLVFVAAALLVLPAIAQAGQAVRPAALGKLAGRFTGSLAGPQGLFRAAPSPVAVSKAGSAQVPPPAGSPPTVPGGQAPAPGTATTEGDERGTMIPDGQH